MDDKKYDGPNWMTTILAHKDEFNKNEKGRIEKAIRMYRGDPWTKDQKSSSLQMVSFNILFAIVESATSATVPNNLEFTVYEKPETPSNDAEKWLARAGRRGDWNGEACLSMVDAMLTGRSILKTVPNEATGFPSIVAVSPQRIFFDLAVRRTSDIQYFIEFAPMRLDTFKARLKKRGNKAPIYTLPNDIKDVKALATLYPDWLNEAANKTEGTDWVPVWEVVDVGRGVVTHWLDGQEKQPLCEWSGEDFYNPYTLYNLNLNAVDCRGLSEVSLVEDTVAAINRILVYWAEIVRKQVPITAYDSSRTTEAEMANMGRATPSSFVGINTNGAPPSSVIQNIETARVPPDLTIFMAKLEQVVSYVTGISDMQRGQVVGAKTATELAVIEAANKTRLQHRIDRFNAAWEDAARKALFLGRRGGFKWLPEPYDVEMIAYSPLQKNREVLRERFLNALQIIGTRPDSFNFDEIDKLLVEVFDLPLSVLLTPEQKAGRAQAAAPPPPATAPVPIEEAPPPVTPGTAELPGNATALLEAAGAQEPTP